MLELTVTPVTGQENALSMLGRKYVDTGGNLNFAEDVMALSSYASTNRAYYGPEMPHLRTLDLPENVKGALVSYGS